MHGLAVQPAFVLALENTLKGLMGFTEALLSPTHPILQPSMPPHVLWSGDDLVVDSGIRILKDTRIPSPLVSSPFSKIPSPPVRHACHKHSVSIWENTPGQRGEDAKGHSRLDGTVGPPRGSPKISPQSHHSSLPSALHRQGETLAHYSPFTPQPHWLVLPLGLVLSSSWSVKGWQQPQK